MPRVASIPSTPGIDRSIRTTSGARPAASSTASAPSPASPTTSTSPAFASTCTIPARTTAWSSATTTRITRRAPRARDASPARLRVDVERAAELDRAVGEQRAQPPHALARHARALAERLSGGAVARRSTALGGRGERHRDPRQVLDDPVVEVGRDPPPLEVRRLDRTEQQLLPLPLALS